MASSSILPPIPAQPALLSVHSALLPMLEAVQHAWTMPHSVAVHVLVTMGTISMELPALLAIPNVPHVQAPPIRSVLHALLPP